MKNNLQQKVTLSLLAGAMLFGTGYIANTSVVYAAIASKDINFESNISDGMTRNGLTVREQAENDEKAENNTIIISGGDAYDVYAAVTGGGDAVGNTAQMSGGEVAYLGGAATDYGDGDDGSAINNKVIMSDGKAQEVVGGEAFGTGIVQGNGVEMSGGTAQNLYGGATYNSSATGNYVEISGNAIVTGSGDNGYEEGGDRITNKGVYGAISGDPNGDNEGIFGSLKNNSVKISGEAQVSNAYGAYSFGGADVIGNSVEIRESAVIGSDKQGEGQVYGAYTAAGNAQRNKVLIAGGTVNDAFGAQTETGIATENLLEITSGTVHDAYEAVTGGGDAVGNIAQMSGGTVAYLGGAATDYGDGNDGSVIRNKVIMSDGKAQEVVGGEAFGTGIVQGNGVEMSGGTAQNLYGGATYFSKAEGNYVKVSGNAVVTGSEDNGYEEDSVKTTNKGVYGAMVVAPEQNDKKLGDLVNNSVVISGNAKVSNVYGAYSEGDSNVTGNAVTISENAEIGSGSGQVFGASTGSGMATGNYVTINGGEAGDVYAAITSSGDAKNNIATMTSGSVADIGGASTVFFDKNSNGAVINNKVVMSGGTAEEAIGGEAYGTGLVQGNGIELSGGNVENVYGGITASSNAEGNYVKVSGNAVVTGNNANNAKVSEKGVYGAVAFKFNVDTGDLVNNSVEISGNAKVTNVYGAYNEGSSSVVNNKVTISDNAEISGNIYGGYIKGSGTASGNIVVIDAKVTGEVYGGYSENSGSILTGNTIELHDNAVVDNAKLFGSYKKDNASQAFYILKDLNNKNKKKENILAINDWNGAVEQLKNFDEITFNRIKWQDGTVLTIKDAGNSDLSNTVINAEHVEFTGGTEMQANTSMNLIAAANESDSKNLGINEAKVILGTKFIAGVSQKGTGEVKVVNGVPKLVIKEVRTTQQVNLVAENRAVAAAFVNQGSELIADALDTLSRTDGYGVKTFAAVYGNHSKYDVNSDLKINGWSSIVGVGSEKQLAQGGFSWGVFYENGSGNYRTANSFNNEFFRGDGSLVYNGGGIAARYAKKSGSYTEASLRAGMLKSEMDNALKDITGAGYGYKSETAYYGAHLGIGKILTLNESTSVDVYGKFFHTYNEGDNFDVAGDKFEFDSITSDRLRLGTRYTVNKNNKWSSYYGIAWEYEFNGDADMKAMNKAVPTQSMQGSSYMAEIGLNYQPNTASPWSFDLSMRGYAGEREGFSGNVQAIYNF